MTRGSASMSCLSRSCRLAAGHAGPSRGFASSAKTGSKKKKYEPVIFSGIQPTGTPHLGNFLGLFLPFLEMQKTAPSTTPIYLSIVGLHAITLPQDRKQLRDDRRNMLASLLACGVDVERTCLYFQEEVPEHTELAWYLNTLTPVGKLQRMTTWKSRIATSRNSNSVDEVSETDLKLGLLAYPVLQAADVMLYKSTDIPVGEDQQQHIELARDIAESFNRQFGQTFPLPQMRIVPSKRILSLRDPLQKMSKSAPNPLSRIALTDTPAQIHQKLKSALTDSQPTITYDPQTRPGVSNLLTIYSALDESGKTPEQVAEMARSGGWGMGKLKEEVAEVVCSRFEGVRGEFERLKSEEGHLRDVARRGREKAREKAAETMEEVRRVVGLNEI